LIDFVIDRREIEGNLSVCAREAIKKGLSIRRERDKIDNLQKKMCHEACFGNVVSIISVVRFSPSGPTALVWSRQTLIRPDNFNMLGTISGFGRPERSESIARRMIKTNEEQIINDSLFAALRFETHLSGACNRTYFVPHRSPIGKWQRDGGMS
jgi:hypothetical protein